MYIKDYKAEGITKDDFENCRLRINTRCIKNECGCCIEKPKSKKKNKKRNKNKRRRK